LIRSDNDNKKYKFLYLDNGINTLLISDPDSEISAASFTVNIGTRDNPSNIHGLVHLF
jgi:insulysin